MQLHEFVDDGSDPGNCAKCHFFHANPEYKTEYAKAYANLVAAKSAYDENPNVKNKETLRLADYALGEVEEYFASDSDL
jgi:hypothetical protein